MNNDPLDQQLEKLEAQGARLMKGLDDANVRSAVILLAKAVLRLDTTSSRLAKVNIWLTVVIALLGVLQLAVMLFHH
jgi:hypothetical protein